MEIGLPDETGRFQILGIHTARMREYKKLAPDVDLKVWIDVPYFMPLPVKTNIPSGSLMLCLLLSFKGTGYSYEEFQRRWNWRPGTRSSVNCVESFN